MYSSSYLRNYLTTKRHTKFNIAKIKQFFLNEEDEAELFKIHDFVVTVNQLNLQLN